MIVCSLIASSLIALGACAKDGRRDYDSSATCQAHGLKPGTREFDSCMREEGAARALKEQREEFEQRKADEEYWRQRRF